MYLTTGNGGLSRKSLLSAFLTDYIKVNCMLFDFNLFESKIIPKEHIPSILFTHLNNLSGKEIFEIISMIDFMQEVELFGSSMKTYTSDSKKISVAFPNLDLSVYGEEKSFLKSLIFEAYPTVGYVYDYILETRKLVSQTKQLNFSNIDVVNFKTVVQKTIKFTNQKDFQKFTEDFKNLSSVEISNSVSSRLLTKMKEKEVPNFSKIFPTCIFNKELSLITPIYYQTSFSGGNGCLSDFSNFVYSMLHYSDFMKNSSSGYVDNIKQLNNHAVLEKVLHLKEFGGNLQNFISSVVNKSFIKEIIRNGNTSELIRLVDENENFFSQEGNDSIFIVCMLIDVKKTILERKEELKAEITSIIEKEIELQYRFAELEMYTRNIIDSVLDKKKIQEDKDNLNELFYKSFNNIFYEIIYECFDTFIEKEEKETL
ncbi:hypothetical protein [Poseidonibacter ostreae]|uniref:Uncharacterized protein n=1 Tax=Poseidonibacter ostreae TaxID=2654171 RepID=A0A6L4WXX7_9BACT|nr:hypothetical protein [Poseidonibacter ostreae]KAB7891310.1 hypothetical protein GBG19_00305 [Poseidonibacter ostreae]